MGQEGFGAHSKAKQVSKFMQTKFLCHKMYQNTPILSVSYSSDYTTLGLCEIGRRAKTFVDIAIFLSFAVKYELLN